MHSRSFKTRFKKKSLYIGSKKHQTAFLDTLELVGADNADMTESSRSGQFQECQPGAVSSTRFEHNYEKIIAWRIATMVPSRRVAERLEREGRSNRLQLYPLNLNAITSMLFNPVSVTMLLAHIHNSCGCLSRLPRVSKSSRQPPPRRP